MATIRMAIKPKYLDQILRGVKTTEYRSISTYWVSKLVDTTRYSGMDNDSIRQAIITGKRELYPRKYDSITFFDGKRIVVVQMLDTKIYRGHEYFAIALGKIIKK